MSNSTINILFTINKFVNIEMFVFLWNKA